MRIFQRECLVAGIFAVAGAQRALEDTIAYARERYTFEETSEIMKEIIAKKLEL